MLRFTFKEWLIENGYIDSIDEVESVLTPQEVEDLHEQYLEEEGFTI